MDTDVLYPDLWMVRSAGRRELWRGAACSDAIVLLVAAGGLMATLSISVGVIMSSGYAALAFLTVGQFFMGCASGVIPGTFLNITPPTLRGRISGLYFCIVNIVAVGGGPTLFAIVTDHVFRDAAKLNLALFSLTLLLATVIAIALSIAIRRYPRAVAIARAAEQAIASRQQ